MEIMVPGRLPISELWEEIGNQTSIDKSRRRPIHPPLDHTTKNGESYSTTDPFENRFLAESWAFLVSFAPDGLPNSRMTVILTSLCRLRKEEMAAATGRAVARSTSCVAPTARAAFLRTRRSSALQ